jgi:hypothetical protein
MQGAGHAWLIANWRLAETPLDSQYYSDKDVRMKVTDYFRNARKRPDRATIKDAWIQHVCEHPEYRRTQADGRIQCWARIEGAGNRYLRVILLPDGETIHNAFFDRRFKP